MAAAEGVEGADALGRQRPGDQFSAVGELGWHGGHSVCKPAWKIGVKVSLRGNEVQRTLESAMHPFARRALHLPRCVARSEVDGREGATHFGKCDAHVRAPCVAPVRGISCY